MSLAQVIGPAFFPVHHDLKTGAVTELWLKGGRGSLKSSFISEEIFLGLQADPLAHAFISRRYDNELRDSVFGQMEWAANKLRVDHVWRFMTSPMQAVNQETGQKILFRGIDNPLKAKSINLGFGFIKFFWAEEVDQYGGMEELRTIQQSIFRGEGTGQISFFSFNPPKSARSWVNREVTIPKLGRLVHHSDYRSVPPAWLGERFIAEAAHLEQVNPVAYRHEYLGEEVGTGLEVFNNVELRAMDDDEIDTLTNVRQGLDWGYAVDPVCLVRLSYDRKRRRLYITGEVSGIGVQNRALDDRTPEEWKRTLTRADSSEPKSVDDMRGEYGWNVIPAVKAKGSVEFGVKWLQSLEKIIIDPVRCPLSAAEFVNYALAMTRTGEVISEFPDKDNHAIDATRYGAEEWMKPEPVTRPAIVAPPPRTSRWG